MDDLINFLSRGSGGSNGAQAPDIRMPGAPAPGGASPAGDAGLAKMLEGMPGLEGMNKEEIMGHADRLWKHMDNLAEDPKAYQDFLEKQAEAAGMPVPGQAPPKGPPPPRNASLIINTKFQKAPAKRPPPPPGAAPVTLAQPGPMVHVVIALWQAAGPGAAGLGPAVDGGRPLSLDEPPQDWQRVSVPFRMRVQPFEQRTSEGKSAVIYEVACHKDTVDLAMSEAPAAGTFRHVLVELAFRWLEETQKIALGRAGRQMRLLTSDGAGDQDSAAVSAAAAAGTGAAGMSQGLLDQLAGLGTSTAPSAPSIMPKEGQNAPKESTARPLIQEVSQPLGATESGSLPLKYEVAQMDGGLVQVRIRAPDGVEAADFDIEAEAGSLIIGPTFASCRTAVTLPAKVDPDSVLAKFDKKARCLTVKLTVKPAAP